MSSPRDDYSDFYDDSLEIEATANDELAPNSPLRSDDANLPSGWESSQDHEDFELSEANPPFPDSGSPIGSAISDIGLADIGVTFELRKSQFLQNLLEALREHVFNIMPIRLLCFTPQASKLRIRLIERGEIYSHIESHLDNNIDFADVFHEITRLELASERKAEEKVIKQLIKRYSRYAILSHTWLREAPGEITYGSWNQGEFDAQQPGYQKLVNFCKAAWEDHIVAFGWMDTVCINKDSSAELDESIRSMYKWYRGAHVCITYLADTMELSDMFKDPWFTRGWTLQELVAPSLIKFYNAKWNKLVESVETDKRNSIIQDQIEQATTITASELRWIPDSSISRRMEMAARRQVTREEDSAYSLMGIFDVSILIAYGEGSERAFSRLLQEIFSSANNVVDIFNWAGPLGARTSALLPLTPRSYLRRSSNQALNLSEKPIKPMMLTHLGLRVTIALMPAVSIQDPTLPYHPIGDYHAIADVFPLADDLTAANNIAMGGKYSLLDARISGEDASQWPQLTFGILNIGSDRDKSTIMLPKHCLAVALDFTWETPSKNFTESPIVFTLNAWRSSDEGTSIHDGLDHDGDANGYRIRRDELARHGIKLITLYL
ncbi:hypothetical protein BJ912DRAFT_110138 [Pholiota molesta]|nr:hypothetical protein BJ912DRAFT_110138 [Pholiota molesta]